MGVLVPVSLDKWVQRESIFFFKIQLPFCRVTFPQFVGANVRCWKVCDRVWWVFSGGKTLLNLYSLLAVVKNSSGIYKLSLLLAGRHIWIEMIIWIISLFPLTTGKDRLLEIKQMHYALHYNIFSSILGWRLYFIHFWDPIVRKRLI